MTRTKWLQGALALGIVAAASVAYTADHLDSPAVTADPASDITDVYSWVDGDNLVMVMNVSPLATAETKFSDAVQYALHLESTAAFGQPGTSLDVICTFDSKQVASCWVGDKDYVTGDASSTAGLKSASGKVRVFAGPRADPFFFNFEGFNDAVSTVTAAAPTLTFDGTGCPAVDAATSGVVVGMLQGTAKGTAPAVDFFANLNVLSIVIEVDKSLVTAGGPIVAVWGSTHKAGG